MIDGNKKLKSPDKFSGVLAKIMSSFGLTNRYNGWTVVSKWSEIVGDEIAQKAKAINFEDGCLFVAVEDDSWRQELSMRTDEILKKIKEYPFGRAIKKIRLIHSGKGIQ
jgi:predicted nucleic acid-binding Zn ribbon protein